MAVIRVNHTDNYTVMSNFHLRDEQLSLKAKGLLSQMLSLPPTWDYTVSGLVAINREKETAITAALKELKKNGYLIVTKLLPNQTESGRYEYIYDIYENPKQAHEKQVVENLGVEIQAVENQGQLNKDELNTDKKNTDNKRFVPPTLDEVTAYCNERGNDVNPEYFIAYYASQKWKKSNGQPVSNWQQCVITWEKRNNGTNKQQQKPQTKFEKQKEKGYYGGTEIDADEVRKAYERLQQEAG